MKLLRQEDGYSIYENPDNELVEKIKNHPTPTKFEGHWRLNKGVWSLKEILDNGKHLMISEEGDMTTIDKEAYDDLVTDIKLESINATFLVSDTFNKYYAPMELRRGILLKVTDALIKNPFRTETFYSGVNPIFMKKGWDAYNYEMNFINGSKGNEYRFTLSFGYSNGCMYFNENGEICNRDYNHDFNQNFEPISYEDNKKEFLDYFSDVNELEYANGQWFTDSYAFSIFIDDEEKYCEKFIVNKWPKQSSKNYYLQGQSYRKMVRPKNTETVGREHLLNAINEAIEMLEEKYESREKA